MATTPEGGVARAIHLPHTAYADLADDFERTKAGTGREDQGWRDYMGWADSCRRDSSCVRPSV